MTDPRSYGLALLAKREYSEAELREKLQKKFPENFEDIEASLKEFIGKKWLSDERFCESVIHDGILIKKYGPVKIQQKLCWQKGVNRDLVEQMLAQFYPEKKQVEVASDLAKKKQKEIERRGKTKNEFETQQKVRQFLLGKGFDFEIIGKVV